MNLLKDKITLLVEKTVKKEFGAVEFQVKIDYPSADAHGDYSVNVAFELGKKLGKAPRAVAETLAQKIKLPDWIFKVECAGPGFLNFFIAPKFLTEFLQEVLDEGEKFGSSKVAAGKTVVTDISHPNVAKPMGVHHLLSTIIGNALNKMFKAVGYKVIRDNYLGDYGTQFGKLIYAYKTWGGEEIVKKDPIPELLKLYVKFHDEVEKNASLEDRGRAEFKKLEDGDSENRKLWKWIVDLSLREFQKIYDRLDVSFDYIHGESFYEDKMRAIIDMGIKKGIFVEGEGGALIAPFEGEKYPPCLIKKSDGATLYATRDLARTKYWEDTWRPDLMVNVVDVAQSLYFQQLFEVVRMLGLTRAPNVHAAFGRMRFPEKRMSTRKGNIILLEDLLDEAEERAFKIVLEKNPELDEKQKKEVARQVGIGAVKYAILAQNRTTDITFTWDKMLSLEGNSAPYLQYVYARARAILRKAGSGWEKKGDGGHYILTEPQELALARLLPKLPEVVIHATAEFKPNLIANYLFEVACRFNGFYAAQEVLKAEPAARAARLKLVSAATIAIKNGLKLLGIEAPEEM